MDEVDAGDDGFAEVFVVGSRTAVQRDGKPAAINRQLRDMKGSYEFDPEITNRKGMDAYCGLCGWALALAHAKSEDAAMISGYLGKTDEIDEALTKFVFCL